MGLPVCTILKKVAEFLRRIPEAKKKQVLVVGMTNMIDLIDSAILRRGRFDHVVEVGLPTPSEIAALLDSLLERLPKADDLQLDSVIDALTGRANFGRFLCRSGGCAIGSQGRKASD